MKIERKTAGSVAILALAGEIDDEGRRAWDEQTDAVVRSGRRRLVFDLAQVERFDSSLIAHLIGLVKRLKERGGEMVVTSPSGVLQRTVRVLGIGSLLRVFRSERAALSYFGEGGGSGARPEPPRPV